MKIHEPGGEILCAFATEQQLEDFLALEWLGTTISRYYDLVGRQVRTDVGVIDLLAKEKETGNFVVIELKRHTVGDEVIGQITRYMGWVKEHMAQGAPVRGIILAMGATERLLYALKSIQDVSLYEYHIEFHIRAQGEDWGHISKKARRE